MPVWAIIALGLARPMKGTRSPAPAIMAARSSIRLLGRLEVNFAGGGTGRLPSRTAHTLLAYLALHGDREHANETLCELFWPDSDGDRQAQNLRRAISDLRKALEHGLPLGSAIATRKGHVSVNRNRIETDVQRFLELTGPCADAERQDRLTEAFALYSGPLLPSLAHGWVIGPRMQLEERYGQTVVALCEMLIEQGRLKEAIPIGRAAVVAAPSREDVHVALIHAYRRAGMGVEALRQFEELERILDETWGESPSLKAREALEAAFEDSRAGKHNLPEQLTSFIGREREIEEVSRLSAGTRLLTLTGSGGCGKTRLSLEVARRLVDEYRDGTWLVEFAPLADPGLVAQTVATALGVPERPGMMICQALIEHLSAKRLVIVLDNCEHLLSACAELSDAILRSCPQVFILANSRECMGIAGETTYRVPSLSLPDPKQPLVREGLIEFESVRLFVDRATQVQSSFAVTDQNAAPLASVCYRLDGIPLAIELAAARIRTLSVEELNERLDDRFRLLTGGSRTALPRQQTLRSLIDWSYDLLNETEKALFCRLAVFAGGWTLESAEQVCSGEPVEIGDVLSVITSLCDKSLVVASEGSSTTRYRMLETIRQYARDRLFESGEGSHWRDRHLAHFLELAEEAEKHMSGPNQLLWLDCLDAEHDNLRSVLEWSSHDESEQKPCLRIAVALGRFWLVRGHFSEGRGWLSELLAADESKPADSVRATALNVLGSLAWQQGDYKTSQSHYEMGLAVWRELCEPSGVAQSLKLLGDVEAQRGDFAAAQRLYVEGLTIFQDLGDDRGVAGSLTNLGTLAYRVGDFEAARRLLESALSVQRERGDHWAITHSLTNLGTIAFEKGELDAARTFYEESLRIRRDIGNRQGIATSLNGLGCVALEQGDSLQASALFEESLAMRRKLGDRAGVAQSISNLGNVASFERDYSAARVHYEEGLAIWREIGDLRGIAYSLLNLGVLVSMQCEFASARDLLEESLSIMRKLGARHGIGHNLGSLAGVAFKSGDYRAARRLHRDVLAICRDVGHVPYILDSVERIAFEAACLGEPVLAAKLFGAAEGRRDEFGATLDPQLQDEHDRYLLSARGSLGNDQLFDRALQEGRALTMEQAIALALGQGVADL